MVKTFTVRFTLLKYLIYYSWWYIIWIWVFCVMYFILCLFIHLFNFAVLGIKPSTLQMQVISDSRASNKRFLYAYIAHLSGYFNFYSLEHLSLCILEAFWLANYAIFPMTMSEPRLPCLFFSKLKCHLHFPAILYSVWLFTPILL